MPEPDEQFFDRIRKEAKSKRPVPTDIDERFEVNHSPGIAGAWNDLTKRNRRPDQMPEAKENQNAAI